jgi:Asp-tRNA(Asn)/Glu-tRNA(Gln) amidotransferase A subunit family amidase
MIATSLLKTPEPILAVSGLRKVFGELVAVDDVSFGLSAGGSMAIVGESGSGKTTIAKPWNLDFSPGGSSGGSGASLAAGTPTLATGSDIGCSIRIPSHEGPLARTIEDCLLLENTIAGPHPSDVASLRPKLELPFPLPPIEGMRIALSVDLGCYRVDDDVVANTRSAAEALRGAGAIVEEVTLPWELERRIYQPLGELLERHDALVCPTFAVPALPAEWANDRPLQIGDGEVEDSFDAMMTMPFNIASRCPVLSVPSGRSRDGVPTGLSIVGRTYDDVAVFRIGQALEHARPWLDVPARRPSL